MFVASVRHAMCLEISCVDDLVCDAAANLSLIEDEGSQR